MSTTSDFEVEDEGEKAFDLGETRRCDGDWVSAARLFDKAISLGYDAPVAYELLATTHLNLALKNGELEQSSGEEIALAHFEKAAAAALEGQRKYGEELWHPSYHLAKILFHRQQYSLASFYLSQARAHPCYKCAGEITKLADLARQIEAGSRRLRELLDGPAPNSTTGLDGRKRLNIEHALSPDILLRVMDLGLESDPQLATRMSCICRSFRRVLTNQPSLWRKLVLGRGPRALLKVQTYSERSSAGGGGLKELTITEGFEWEDEYRIGGELEAHAGTIEVLDISLSDAESPLFRKLRRSMTSLRSLTVRSDAATEEQRKGGGRYTYVTTDSLDFDLLPLGSTCLRGLSLVAVLYEYEPYTSDEGRQGGTWTKNPSVQLANLISLNLDSCSIAHSDEALDQLVCYTPKLQAFSIQRTAWELLGFDEAPARPPARRNGPRLEHLTSWCSRVTDIYACAGLHPFSSFWVPNLTHLEYQSCDEDYMYDSLFRQPNGLAGALPKLRSLTLRDCEIGINAYDFFESLTNLAYLSMTNCIIEEELGLDHFLPLNLVALSLGGTEYDTGPGALVIDLRDIVRRRVRRTRLPRLTQRNLASPAYADDAGLESSNNESMSNMLQPSSAAIPSTSLPQSTGDASSNPAPSAPLRLRWLNIDNCCLDEEAVHFLKQHVEFVSHRKDVPEEDLMTNWEMCEAVSAADEAGVA